MAGRQAVPSPAGGGLLDPSRPASAASFGAGSEGIPPDAGQASRNAGGLHQRGGVTHCLSLPHAQDFTRFQMLSGSPAQPPVTGSLDAGLAQWLIGSGVAPHTYVASQGTALT